jgi:hypothetical protein
VPLQAKVQFVHTKDGSCQRELLKRMDAAVSQQNAEPLRRPCCSSGLASLLFDGSTLLYAWPGLLPALQTLPKLYGGEAELVPMEQACMARRQAQAGQQGSLPL